MRIVRITYGHHCCQNLWCCLSQVSGETLQCYYPRSEVCCHRPEEEDYHHSEEEGFRRSVGEDSWSHSVGEVGFCRSEEGVGWFRSKEALCRPKGQWCHSGAALSRSEGGCHSRDRDRHHSGEVWGHDLRCRCQSCYPRDVPKSYC